MRYRITVDSTRYGFSLDDEVEAADADDLALKLRELAARVVRRGEAKSVPSFLQETAALVVESLSPLAFCRYVAQEWNQEHPEAVMPVDFATAQEFAAAAESVGLLRPC
jgi:hypothetical protein